MATQTERQQIYDMTLLVRDLASKNELIVDFRTQRKSPLWKEGLYPFISAEFVMKQLQYIQPYCVQSYDSHVVEFELPYYYHPIFIRVNTRNKIVSSFHYSVDNETNLVKDKPMYRVYQDEDGVDVCDVIVTRKNESRDRVFEFAVGSYVAREENPSTLMSKQNTSYMPLADIKYLVNEFKNRIVQQLITKMSHYIDYNERKNLAELMESPNILTYSKEDKVRHLISLCFDLWEQDLLGNSWVREEVVGFLLTIDPEIYKSFIEHLPEQIRIESGIPSKFIQETSEFSNE